MIYAFEKNYSADIPWKARKNAPPPPFHPINDLLDDFLSLRRCRTMGTYYDSPKLFGVVTKWINEALVTIIYHWGENHNVLWQKLAGEHNREIALKGRDLSLTATLDISFKCFYQRHFEFASNSNDFTQISLSQIKSISITKCMASMKKIKDWSEISHEI